MSLLNRTEYINVKSSVCIPKEVFIIGEIGINHNGDLDVTKQLIDIAIDAGCNAVKFQKRAIDIVYTAEYLDEPRESPWGTTQREQKEGLEFGQEEYEIIDAYCTEKNIEWFASAWDIPSQKFLRQFNLDYNKIASAMVTHPEFLRVVAEERKQTFISTGMSSYSDIDQAVEIFKENNCPFILMHCVSTYPSTDKDLNLLGIISLRERYKCRVGYSGHETGILPPALSVILGAVAIERHITLDRAIYGSDQAASLEPKGLQYLVRDVRSVTTMLGSGNKVVLEDEKIVAKKLRYFEDQ